MHQCIMVGAIAGETHHRQGALTRAMSIDLKTLKTCLLFVNKVLLFLVTYLDEGWAGDEVVVAIATIDASKLL